MQAGQDPVGIVLLGNPVPVKGLITGPSPDACTKPFKLPALSAAVGTRSCSGSDWVLRFPSIIDEEKRLVFSVVQFGDGDRPAQTAAESVKGPGSLDVEIQNGGVQTAVLKVFKRTAMQLIGSALGDEGYVADLGELRVVVERRDFHLGDVFQGWVGVLQRAVETHAGGRNSIHREASLRRRCAPDRDIPLRVPRYLGRYGESRQRTARH